MQAPTEGGAGGDLLNQAPAEALLRLPEQAQSLCTGPTCQACTAIQGTSKSAPAEAHLRMPKQVQLLSTAPTCQACSGIQSTRKSASAFSSFCSSSRLPLQV